MTPIIVKKLKVAQWKNDFIKRPHNTVNLNFSSPKLRVRHCFGFCKGDSSVPHCKALAQLTPSYWKTESSSFKGKQRVTGNLLYDKVFLQSHSSTEPPLFVSFVHDQLKSKKIKWSSF
jgi:hypothetical protein